MAQAQQQADALDAETESAIDGFLNAYRKGAKTTGERYASAMRNFARWLEANDKSLWEVDWRDVHAHLGELVDGDASPSGFIDAKMGIKAFYVGSELYVPEGVEVPDDPTDHPELEGWAILKEPSKKEQALNTDDFSLALHEIQMLADGVSSPTLRNELIIRLLYQTGLRRAELSKVRLSDVDRDEREINVQSDKSWISRVVPYQPSLDFLFSQWLEGGYRSAEPTADTSPYLFPSKKGEKITPKTVGRVVKRAAENAGLQTVMYVDAGGRERFKITAHTLRHTFARGALDPDVGSGQINLRDLQQLMGHKRLATTERYLPNTDYVRAGHDFGPG